MEFTRESLGLLKLKDGDNNLRGLAKRKGIQLRKGAGKEEVITTILNYRPPPKYKRPAPPPPPDLVAKLGLEQAQVVADQEIKYRFAEGSAEEGLMLTRVERDLAKRRLRDINDARIAFEVAEADEQLNIRKIEMGVESDLKLMTPTGMNSAMEQARDAVAKARAIGRIRETKKREAGRVFYDGKEIIFVSGDVPQEGDDDYEPPKPDYFNEAGQLSNERTEERARDSMNQGFYDRDNNLVKLTENLLGQAFEIVSTPEEREAERIKLMKSMEEPAPVTKQEIFDRKLAEKNEQSAMGDEDVRYFDAQKEKAKKLYDFYNSGDNLFGAEARDKIFAKPPEVMRLKAQQKFNPRTGALIDTGNLNMSEKEYLYRNDPEPKFQLAKKRGQMKEDDLRQVGLFPQAEAFKLASEAGDDEYEGVITLMMEIGSGGKRFATRKEAEERLRSTKVKRVPKRKSFPFDMFAENRQNIPGIYL